MSITTKHTARSVLDKFYAAEKEFTSAKEGQQDFSLLRPLFSENFKLYQAGGLPYAGVYHGPDGVLEWMQLAMKWFSQIDVRDSQIFEKEGSSMIMVRATVHYRIRSTGEELDSPFAQDIGVDLERGLITEIRPWYWDVHGLNKKLGYNPETDEQS